MANQFVYSQPVKIYFGVGQFDRLDEVLAELGSKRCVIVCDKFLAPMADKVAEKMPQICGIFSDVEPNPQLSGIAATVKIAREVKADTVIGIGGGSTMDTAKFAAAVTLGDKEPIDYYKGEPFPAERLTILAVPTTAGTGSEVTQVSVVNNGNEKKTINNPVFMPRAALVDPALTRTVPPRTTMNTGIDAMAHALEGYWSKNHQPISDLMAIEAVRTVLANLENAYRDGNDMEARAGMSYGALLGGLAFAMPKTAGSHACSYPLCEDYHMPHGEGVAFTLDSFIRINADERLEHLCHAIGLKDTNELADKVVALKKLGGLRCTLADLGEVDMDKLVHDCAVHPLMNNNPVHMDEAKLREMFEKLR